MKISSSRAEIPGTLVTDYLLREVEAPRELILLLHGYQQNGKYIFDKFVQCCPENALVLAPNGPYPIPERRPDKSYRIGFAWFFYDPSQDDYYVDMKAGLECLRGLIALLGMNALPKRVIGFSQGGYLAGFAAKQLTGVHQVISVAGEFLTEELTEGGNWPPAFRMDSLHGELDDIVSASAAEKRHTELSQLGVAGRFLSIPGQSHRISAEMQAGLRLLLALSSPSS